MTSLIRVTDVDTFSIFTIHANLITNVPYYMLLALLEFEMGLTYDRDH